MNIKYILSIAIFIAGLCSIIYELLISATASYFIGDSITQFAVLIGIYLFSMGVGAYLSKFLKDKPISFFIKVELLLGLIGGLSVPFIYYLFISVNIFTLQLYCYAVMFLIGLLTGMEVPLLTFAFDGGNYKNILSTVLSLDYIGGLIATLIFPFILLPFIGLFHSSLLFGISNVILGLWMNYAIYKKWNKETFAGICILLLLGTFLGFANKLLTTWDEKIYQSPIILNAQSPHQKIVLTENKDNVRLFLNRQLQFSSLDEYRYHEMLAHVPLVFKPEVKTVLVLGGGENLVSRELLKHKNIESIEVVDIDSTMFYLSKTNSYLKKINQEAVNDKRVKLIVDDAFLFLRNSTKKYDLIIADLPDPSNDILARLYSKQFYLLVKKNLENDGLFVSQSCDVYFTNKTFNCIVNTMGNVFEHTLPYQIFVPSFGNWGFTLASSQKLQLPETIELPEDLSFLDENQLQVAFNFPKDIPFVSTKINSIDHPFILDYFLEEWKFWRSNVLKNN